MGKSRFPHKTTSGAFKHKCKYCEPLIVHFTQTKQPIGSIVRLVDGTEYKGHETGAWIGLSGRKEE